MPAFGDQLKQPLERILPDTSIPASVDVVIVGGGIAGCSTAWELARAGVKVALLEKGLIGAEQSSRNWGWVRQQGRDPKELELARLSLDLWPQLSAQLGRNVGFHACGVTFVTQSEKELSSWKTWRDTAAGYGIKSEILSAQQVRQRVPGCPSASWAGGLTTPADGRAEPARVAPYMAMAAQKLGAAIVEQCAVETVETTNGRVSGVVTEKGHIGCGAVVIAGGAWSSLFLQKMGISFPQAFVHGSVAYMQADSMHLRDSIVTPNFAIRECSDGGFIVAKGGRGTVYITPALLRHAWRFWPTFQVRRKNVQLRLGRFWQSWREERNYISQGVSPFTTNRILDPEPNMALLDDAVRLAREAFPRLSEGSVQSAWGGCIDSTPDAVPVLSGIDTLPGLFVASGFSGHGFGLGPGVGLAMASLVQGRSAPIDMAPFSFTRMTDGRRLEPYLLL